MKQYSQVNGLSQNCPRPHCNTQGGCLVGTHQSLQMTTDLKLNPYEMEEMTISVMGNNTQWTSLVLCATMIRWNGNTYVCEFCRFCTTQSAHNEDNIVCLFWLFSFQYNCYHCCLSSPSQCSPKARQAIYKGQSPRFTCNVLAGFRFWFLPGCVYLFCC